MKKFKVTIFNRFAPNERHTEYVDAETEAEAERNVLGGGLVNYASGWGILSTTQMDLDYESFTKDQVDEVECAVDSILSSVFTDAQDRDEVVDAILNDVMADIEETADWSDLSDNEICTGDVAIAVARVIKERVTGN